MTLSMQQFHHSNLRTRHKGRLTENANKLDFLLEESPLRFQKLCCAVIRSPPPPQTFWRWRVALCWTGTLPCASEPQNSLDSPDLSTLARGYLPIRDFVLKLFWLVWLRITKFLKRASAPSGWIYSIRPIELNLSISFHKISTSDNKSSWQKKH